LLLPFALGGITFAAAQIPLLEHTTASSGENMGWFLNSGQSILTITLSLVTVAAAITALGWWAPMVGAVALSVGATVAMVVILFQIGAGNLFPIVIVMGGVFVGIAAFVGMRIGVVLRHAFTRRQ
jgi:hypothetical protein